MEHRMMPLRVTIEGEIGSGKTTLAIALKKLFDQYGISTKIYGEEAAPTYRMATLERMSGRSIEIHVVQTPRKGP
jgi:thymidylate kinase